jgi:maintenance of morphology protein 1
MRTLFQHISAELNGTAATPTANPEKKGVPKTNLAFSFLPDYRLDLSVRSLIGSRSRLQDVPKVAQLVEARIQSWFEERVVEPRVQVVGLPDFWPRKGRTGVRPGDDVEAAAAVAAASVSSRSGGPAETTPSVPEEAIIDDSPVRPGLRFRGPAGRYDSAESFDELPRASPGLGETLDIPGSMPGGRTP